MTAETDKKEAARLSVEISELRLAVLHLAAHLADIRSILLKAPIGREGENKLSDLTSLLHILRSIPADYPDIAGSSWLVALEKRSGKRLGRARLREFSGGFRACVEAGRAKRKRTLSAYGLTKKDALEKLDLAVRAFKP